MPELGGYCPHCQREWEAPALPEYDGGSGRSCDYCMSAIHQAASRCPSCAGEFRFCKRCNAMVGLRSRQKFVGLARGGTKTQYRCMHCDKVLDGPRF